MDASLDGLVGIAFAALLACTLAASIRIAFLGTGRMPTRQPMRVVTHDNWWLMLFLLAPWVIGDVARGDMSPMPWKAFIQSNASHGLFDGFLSAAMVSTVDLWALWIPGQIYVTNRRDQIAPATARMARLSNLAVGLLLLTPWNPIYRFIAWQSPPH